MPLDIFGELRRRPSEEDPEKIKNPRFSGVGFLFSRARTQNKLASTAVKIGPDTSPRVTIKTAETTAVIIVAFNE